MYVQVRATRRCGQPRRPRRRSALARAVASNPMCEAATARVVRSLCNLVLLCHRRALLRHTLAQGAYVGVPPPALPDEEEPPEAAPPPPLPTTGASGAPWASGASSSGGNAGSIGGWCGSSAAPSAAPSPSAAVAVSSGERYAALSVEDVDLMEDELPAATERALQEALEMPVFE